MMPVNTGFPADSSTTCTLLRKLIRVDDCMDWNTMIRAFAIRVLTEPKIKDRKGILHG
jgi:hypothetical protein